MHLQKYCGQLLNLYNLALVHFRSHFSHPVFACLELGLGPTNKNMLSKTRFHFPRLAQSNKGRPSGSEVAAASAYDFCFLSQHASAGKRSEECGVAVPMAWPEYLEFYTKTAESWRRSLAARVFNRYHHSHSATQPLGWTLNCVITV